MLFEVLRSIKNYFPVGSHDGSYKIEDGNITLDFLKKDQYFLIEGSVFNDGIHQYSDETVLDDEEFDGVITALAIPKDFLSLVSEIEDWQTANGNAGAYQSESFGGYSYSRGTNNSGNANSWKEAFASRLNAWRKI